MRKNTSAAQNFADSEDGFSEHNGTIQKKALLKGQKRSSIMEKWKMIP